MRLYQRGRQFVRDKLRAFLQFRHGSCDGDLVNEEGALGVFVAVPIAGTGRIVYHFHLRLCGPPGSRGKV
jgi:hypothetical protein